MLDVDEHFDLMWKLAFGDSVVTYNDVQEFKKSLGMSVNNMYLTNREASQDRMYVRLHEDGIGMSWKQVGTLNIKERGNEPRIRSNSKT